MKAGRKRHLVTVMRKSDELDRFGKQIPPEKMYSFRCNVAVLSASNPSRNGASLTSEYLSILAAYDKRLKHDDMLQWDGNEYEIEMIKPSINKREMVITARNDIDNDSKY